MRLTRSRRIERFGHSNGGRGNVGRRRHQASKRPVFVFEIEDRNVREVFERRASQPFENLRHVLRPGERRAALGKEIHRFERAPLRVDIRRRSKPFVDTSRRIPMRNRTNEEPAIGVSVFWPQPDLRFVGRPGRYRESPCLLSPSDIVGMGHRPGVIDELVHGDVHVLDEAPIAVVVDAVGVLRPHHLRNKFDERLKERLDDFVRRHPAGFARHRHVFSPDSPHGLRFVRAEQYPGRLSVIFMGAGFGLGEADGPGRSDLLDRCRPPTR